MMQWLPTQSTCPSCQHQVTFIGTHGSIGIPIEPHKQPVSAPFAAILMLDQHALSFGEQF
jgi:hypothetical protein